MVNAEIVLVSIPPRIQIHLIYIGKCGNTSLVGKDQLSQEVILLASPGDRFTNRA